MAKTRGRQEFSVNPMVNSGRIPKTTFSGSIPDVNFDIDNEERYEAGDRHQYIDGTFKAVYECTNNASGAAIWVKLFDIDEGDTNPSTDKVGFIDKSTLVEAVVTYNTEDIYIDYPILLKDKNANYFKFDVTNVIATSRKAYAFSANIDLTGCPNDYYCILDFDDTFSKGSPKVTITTPSGVSSYLLPFRSKVMIVKNDTFKVDNPTPVERCSITILENPTCYYTGFMDVLPIGSIVVTNPITGQSTTPTFALPLAANAKENSFCEVINGFGSDLTIVPSGANILFYPTSVASDTIIAGTSRTYVKSGNNAWIAYV